MIRPYITVDGTHGYGSKDEWTNPDSPFRKNLSRLGYEPLSANYPFVWSTAIDGVDGKNYTWLTSGIHLFYYVAPPLFPEHRIPPEQTLVIAYSHGAQVALQAFARGMKGRLITVNPPVRNDMASVVALARPNIIRWTNLYGDFRDFMALMGALRDGHLGICRQFKEADNNFLVKGGHGAALKDKRWHESWKFWLDETMK